MQTLNTDTRGCTKPDIIAGRLASIRNIYLRKELRTIAHQIQEKHKERLPALQLVSIAAYEQVFNRQPLSLPEVLRRDAVKYGLRYYELNMSRLQTAEAPTIPINSNISADAQIDENRSVSSDSKGNRSSLTSMKRGIPSNSSDTNSIETSVSSDESTNERDFSTTSTFTDTSSNTDLPSSTSNTFSKSVSNGSMANTKMDQASAKQLSRTKPPKIIVRRPSNNSLASSHSKNSLIKISDNRMFADKKPISAYHLSPTERKKKKSRNKNAFV